MGLCSWAEFWNLIRYLFPSDVKRKSASELKRECMETAADQRLNVNKKANMKAQLEAKIILLRKEKDTNLVEFGVMNSASNNISSVPLDELWEKKLHGIDVICQ